MALDHFSVNSFKNNFESGARANLFKAYLDPPGNLQAPSFEFRCQTASLPGETVGIIEQPYMGRVYKIPGNRTFEDWTTTIIVDEDYALRSMFEAWSQQMGGNYTNLWTAGEAENVYAQNLAVAQYKRDGSLSREYKFIHAWPSSITAIELGWDSNDAVETFDVTWTYSWHETKDIASIIGGTMSWIKDKLDSSNDDASGRENESAGKSA